MQRPQEGWPPLRVKTPAGELVLGNEVGARNLEGRVDGCDFLVAVERQRFDSSAGRVLVGNPDENPRPDTSRQLDRNNAPGQRVLCSGEPLVHPKILGANQNLARGLTKDVESGYGSSNVAGAVLRRPPPDTAVPPVLTSPGLVERREYFAQLIVRKRNCSHDVLLQVVGSAKCWDYSDATLLRCDAADCCLRQKKAR